MIEYVDSTMSSMKINIIKKIAIVGAGPSGLAIAKYLIEEKVFSKIVIHEQRHSVGGVWNHTPYIPSPSIRHDTAKDARKQPIEAIDTVIANLPTLNTPMYDYLEINLPHMLFPSQEVVLQYLQDYAKDMMSLIKFNHEVVQVQSSNNGKTHSWDVFPESPGENDLHVDSFDAVVAANGHCDWPLLLDIEGLDAWSRKFPRSLHHSVSYKNAGCFADKRVLLVGGGPSGADIGNQIAAECKHLLLRSQISKSPYHIDKPYIRDLPVLKALIPRNVQQDLPMEVLNTLHSDIEEQGIQALQLYKHIFYIEDPTLAFIETPEMIVPFPLAESQAAIVARVWSGRLTLPIKKKMEGWRQTVIGERGTGRGFHTLKPPSDLDYMKEMYDWSCEASDAENSGKLTRGKIPKSWDARACWLRMMAPEMRKAFNAKGEIKSNILGY